MTWKELFANKANYADDLVIQVPGIAEPMKLGELRAHDAAHHGETAAALQTREQQIAERETRTTAAQQKLADIMEAVARTTGLSFDQIVSGDTAAAQAAAEKFRTEAGRAGITTTAGGDIDWANDPIYAPVEKRFAPFAQQQQQIQQVLRAGMTVVQNDRTELAYLRFKVENPEAAKDLKYEDAVRLAVDKGYKDEVGFPNVRKALDDLAAPSQTAAREADLVAKAREEGAAAERARMFGNAPQPGGMGTAGIEFASRPDAGGKVSSIQEQLAKAMSDPTMMVGGPIQ